MSTTSLSKGGPDAANRPVEVSPTRTSLWGRVRVAIRAIRRRTLQSSKKQKELEIYPLF